MAEAPAESSADGQVVTLTSAVTRVPPPGPLLAWFNHSPSRRRSSRNSPATTSSRPASSSRPAVPNDQLAPRWTTLGSSVARTAWGRVGRSLLVRTGRPVAKSRRITLLPTKPGSPSRELCSLRCSRPGPPTSGAPVNSDDMFRPGRVIPQMVRSSRDRRKIRACTRARSARRNHAESCRSSSPAWPRRGGSTSRRSCLSFLVVGMP
jgi:hypothetical protein